MESILLVNTKLEFSFISIYGKLRIVVEREENALPYMEMRSRSRQIFYCKQFAVEAHLTVLVG